MNNDVSPPSTTTPPPSSPTAAASPQPKPRLQRARRAKHLDDLIRTLDILIYCELSILYYMDCSLLHFLLRALPQWLYFTPKPALVPIPPPTRRPYVAALVGTNALVLAAHVWAAGPAAAAGEAVRGYRHGGLLIDFVGEGAPVARWRLVGLDVLVWGLQWLVLVVFLERAGVQVGMGGGGEGALAAGEETGMGMGMGQDYDAEERGVFRAEAGEAGEVEVRDVGAADSEVGERGDLLAEPSGLSSGDSRDHPLDTYHTGEHVIADLHMLDTLRRQWAQYGSVAAEGSTSSTTGSQTAMAAAAAGRRFGFRLRVGDRVLGGGPS